MEPDKSAQIAAKKIQKKYKKIRENKKASTTTTTTKDNKKVQINEPEKIMISEPPAVAPQSSSKVSTIRTANKIKEKYLKIRKNKNSQKITDQSA